VDGWLEWIAGVGWTGFVWHSLVTDFGWLFEGHLGQGTLPKNVDWFVNYF